VTEERVGAVIGVGAVTWGLVGVAAMFGAVSVVLVPAWLTGRLTLDLGLGRTLHPLGPISMDIRAPRTLVYEVIAGPYLGTTPREMRGELEVLERGRDFVVAAHHTKLSRFTSTTVESVGFMPPETITFRLLRGIAPDVTERLELHEEGDGTRLDYSGELEMDLWALGRFLAKLIVRTWERVVRDHLERTKQAAEARNRSARSSAG
jgi:hypothetical protein